MYTWPPQLADLKHDLKIGDSRDDARLQSQLDAAIEFVEDKRAGDFDFSGRPPTIDTDLSDAIVPLPVPGHRMCLGAIRLAGRWYNRLRSPDGLVDMGDAGSVRIPTVDPDIEQMLGIGRYREPMCG